MNEAIISIVKVFEGFADGAPLSLDLVDEFFYWVAVVGEVRSSSSHISTLLRFLIDHVLMKIDVAAGVVAEDKTSKVMNLIAHPQAKVSIVEAA